MGVTLCVNNNFFMVDFINILEDFVNAFYPLLGRICFAPQSVPA